MRLGPTLLAFTIAISARGQSSELNERRLDPSLKLLYRAQRGGGKPGLTRGKAAEAHERLRGPKRGGAGRTAPASQERLLDVLVKYSGDPGALAAAGFRPEATVGSIHAGAVAIEDLPALTEVRGVTFIQAAREMSSGVVDGRPTTDSVRTAAPGRAATATGRIGALATGTGVLVAFIDTGVDVFHEDFRRPDGSTRIRALLDFSEPGDTDGDGDLDGAGPYGGTLYSEADVNAALQAGSFTSRDTTGHGTHGLSVAAGDDPSLPGLAPAADLLVVKATREDGSLAFTSTDIVNALAWVDATAEGLGQPYVANLSLGTLFSSHDGRSLEEQAIDALVGSGKPGKAIVVAAGNSSDNRGGLMRHLAGKAYVGIPSVHTLTVPAYTPNPGKGNDRAVVDLWYQGNDRLKITVTSPNNHVVTAPFGDYADESTPDGDVFIANMGGPSPSNGDIEAVVLIDDWSGPAPEDGSWTLAVEAEEVGEDGTFHAWVTEDSVLGSQPARFGGAADNLLLLGKPGGAYNAITVGSYARHAPGTRYLTAWTDVNSIGRTDTTAVDGDLSDFSSPGKTRDGRQKPELTAPGERVMGAVSRDAMPGVSPTSIYAYHPFTETDALLTDETPGHAFGLLQGTSFSAPVVSGLAARILSTDPELDAIQVRNILASTAVADAFTGAVPNPFWGYGKVDESIGGAPLPGTLRIDPDVLPNGILQRQYNFVLTASGGTLPYSWVVAGGSLPPGLTLETGGFLTGKPTTAGSFPLTFQVVDASSPAKSRTKAFTLVVLGATPLEITTKAHPVAHTGRSYQSILQAVGGTPPYQWTLAGGTSLPPGLALNAGGWIAGTATTTGTYSFTVTVQDAVAASATRSCRIRVVSSAASDWSALGKAVPRVNNLAIDPTNPNRAVAQTGGGFEGVFETLDAGASWRPISINNGFTLTSGLPPVVAFDPTSSELWLSRRYCCVGSGWGTLATWYDSGTRSWSPIGAPQNGPPEAIAFSSSGRVFSFGTYPSAYLVESVDHQPWTTVGGASGQPLCGGGDDALSPYYPTHGSLDLSPSVIYVGRGREVLGERTYVCASLDGGLTWTDVTNGSWGWSDIHVSPGDDLDVMKSSFGFPGHVTSRPVVERSEDGGRNWARTFVEPTGLAGQSGVFRRSRTAPNVAFVATDVGLFKSTDNGTTWAAVSVDGRSVTATAVAIDPGDEDVVLVAADTAVHRSTDGGATWQRASSGLVRYVLRDLRVSPTNPSEVALASTDGAYLSRTEGQAWTRSVSGMAASVLRRLAISGEDPDLYLAGTEDAVYRSTNRGVTWSRVDGGVAAGYPVTALEADPSSAQHVLFSLSGSRGTYRSTDGGLSFASANVGLPYGTPNDLSFARDAGHEGRVFIALTNDGLYRSEDRGASWSAFGLNTQTMRVVEPAPSNSDYVYAAGATGTYFFDPAVGTWTVAAAGPVSPVLSLAVDPVDHLVAYAGADHPGSAGSYGGVYRTTDGGRTWTRTGGPVDQLDVVALAAHPTVSGIVWAATENGGVYRTDDGGATWRELGNYGTVADLTNVNVPDPSNPFLLFAGTEGYGVQASTDNGKSFVPRVAGLGNLYVNAVAFDPATPSTLYAATDAGVFVSTNSANSWAATPLASGEVTDLVTDNDGSAKRIWATVRGQGVAFSANGGESFTLQSSGLASLELTGLEVETRGSAKRIWATSHGGQGVAYSDDLGLSWVSAAGNGLTNRDVNDLAIQSGTAKRIWATTDSGVFVSENDGLSWRDMSLGLPSGIPATSVSIDPNSGEALVSLFSNDGGGVYRGGNVSGTFREYNSGLGELKVRKLTRGAGYGIDAETLGARFYAATAGDGVYTTVLATSVEGSPVVSTHRLPRGLLRASFNAALAATGGTPPYTWSLQEGALPAGLGLEPSTGAITGEPGALGFFSFTVQVADANQRVSQKALTIEVASADEVQVTSVSPAVGLRGESPSVVVSGASFVATPTVSFGPGVSVTSVTFDSATQLTVGLAIDAGATAGYRTVTVTNPSTASSSLVDGFKVDYPTPSVTGVSPVLGSRKETLDITIAGSHFESGATVSFGSGVTVNGVAVGGPTSLTANVTVTSGAALGARDVTVTNVNGLSAGLPAAFTVRAAKPGLSGVSPTQASQGTTLVVTLNGADFQSGAAASFGDGVTVNSTTFVSAAQLLANVTIAPTATLGFRTVTVSNADGQSGSYANAIRIMGPPPQVLSTSPSQGNVATSFAVAIEGANFQPGAVASFGSGIAVGSTDVVSPTRVTANITVSAGAVPGTRDVVVTNADGQPAGLAAAFRVLAAAPTLASTLPVQGPRGTTLDVTISGTGFDAGSTVSFGSGTTVGAVVLFSSTSLKASVTIDVAAALGSRTVTVTNGDGQQATLVNGFTVVAPPPAVSLVVPESIPACGTTDLIVKGTGFQPGITLDLGAGVTVDSLAFENAARLSATVTVTAAASKGARPISVHNPDGGSGSSSNVLAVLPAAYTHSAVAYAWIDASDGTLLPVSGDDVSAVVPIGFPFPFYGVSYDDVTVSSNGYLTFGGPGDVAQNTTLPYPASPKPLVAALWGDLEVRGDSAVRARLLGTAPERRLVVQWTDVHPVGRAGTLTFEAILSEKTGSILLQYRDVVVEYPPLDNGGSATAGIQDETGSTGVQISANAPLLQNATAYLVSTPCAGGPELSPIPSPLVVGATTVLGGSGFTAGSVVKLYVATSGGIATHGPFAPVAHTSTSLEWDIPSTIPLGNGFGAVQVVNTDEGFSLSNTEGQLLFGDPGDNLPTITAVNGVPLNPADSSVPLANVSTLVTAGSPVTLSGAGFNGALVNLFTASGNAGPLSPLGGATPTQIEVVIPPGTPTGPGSFQVVNGPYTGNVLSNAVSAPIGELVTISSVTVLGSTVTVNGTGFCPLTVVNLFNVVGGNVLNLGGVHPDGSPKIPLTIVDSTRFTFEKPAGAQAGPAFVQALNPPYIPYSSSGNDPDGAFTFP